MFAGGGEPIRQARGRVEAYTLRGRVTAASQVCAVLTARCAASGVVCAIGALCTVCMQADQGSLREGKRR